MIIQHSIALSISPVLYTFIAPEMTFLSGKAAHGTHPVRKAADYADSSLPSLKETSFGDNARVHQGNVVNYYLGEYRADSAYISRTKQDKLTGIAGQGCIADLRVTDPRLDMIRLQDSKGPLIRECYQWIFDHPEFTAWRRHDKNSVLWVNGDPGKGKTMLLMGIIHALSPLKSEPNPIYVSHFFCERADPRLTTATSVLRGLLYMIVMERPNALFYLEERYKRAGRQLFEDANAFYALSEIFWNIINDLQVVLVVDAIDECREGLAQLLDFIEQTKYAASTVKWVVSSRRRPYIVSRMRARSSVVNLDLELNWRYVSDAVGAYINQKLPFLAKSKEYDSQLYHAVREYLQTRAEDTFLWVSAVCSVLKSKPRRKALSVLKAFPDGLRIIYQHMLDEIQSTNDVEDTEYCKRMLASMVSSRRPMRLIELGATAWLPSDYMKDQDSLRELIGSCGSFLTIRGDAVYLVHSSAKEFLAAEVLDRNSKDTSHGGLRHLPSRSDTSHKAMYE